MRVFTLGCFVGFVLVITGCVHHLFPPYFAAKPAHYSPLPPPGPGRSLNLEAELAKPRMHRQALMVTKLQAPRFQSIQTLLSAPSVGLSWDVSTDPSVAGYNVYWGVASATYTNKQNVPGITNNTTVVGPLSTNTLYYFAATAYDTNGLESDYSAEVTFKTPAPALYFVLTSLASTNVDGPYAPVGQPQVITNPPGPQLFFKVSVTATNF